MIHAITFDFWDTIAIDNSDEPKRAAKGLGTKEETRYKLFAQEVQRYHPSLQEDQIRQAYAHANDWFTRCWKQEFHTPGVDQRLGEAYRYLGLERSPGFDAMVASWERMEVETPPDLAPGIVDALAQLAQKYQLGIISDTIVTPGWGLHQLLIDYDLHKYFRVFVFSNEVGVAKPHRKVYDEAAKRFNVSPTSMAHVGDREANDVTGPNALGIKSVLYTGVIDRGGATSQASAICQHHDELPGIIAGFKSIP